jgi:hypothetical protein
MGLVAMGCQQARGKGHWEGISLNEGSVQKSEDVSTSLHTPYPAATPADVQGQARQAQGRLVRAQVVRLV